MVDEASAQAVALTKQGNMEDLRGLILSDPRTLISTDWSGDSLLSIACWHGHSEMVKMLIDDFNIDINYTNPSNLCTPLHRACARNHLELAMLLIKRGANMRARDKVRLLLLLKCSTSMPHLFSQVLLILLVW
jgi:ankyrin repeat protein